MTNSDKYRWQFDVIHHAAWRFLAACDETLKAAYLQNRLRQSGEAGHWREENARGIKKKMNHGG